MSVLVVGSVAYDSIETPKGSVDKALGGSATYFSSVASFFTKVNAVGVVGEDYDFDKINYLKERGVGLEGVIQVPGETFSWGGVYGDDPNDRETTFTNLGVFADFDPEIPTEYKNADYVFLANIDPDLQLKVLSQVDNPKLVVLDTMNFWIEGKLESLIRVIEQVDILIVNDSEAKQLTGMNDLFKASKKLLDMGLKYLVIKKGEHGAILISEDNMFFSAIYPVENVVDPTGAGDTFAGGFLGYIGGEDKTDWATLKKAVIYGTASASFTVEDFSVERLIGISKKDIENRVASIKEMTSF